MSSLLNYYRDDVEQFYLTGDLSHELYTKLREYYSKDIHGAFLSKTEDIENFVLTRFNDFLRSW